MARIKLDDNRQFFVEAKKPEIETTWRRILGPFQTMQEAQNEAWSCAERNQGTQYRVFEDVKIAPSADSGSPTGQFWYQCQERSMAPGSGDGWPATIRPQHSGNARLVRRNGEPSDWLNLMRDIDRRAMASGCGSHYAVPTDIIIKIRTHLAMFG